jgi:cation:H+ antiporter
VAGDVALLAASFAVILTGAVVFTNAVEWLGHRLSLAEGAVGSLLAAVGTAMPESLIPIVAILEGDVGADEVAVGAIVGAPFLLATVAMPLIGVAALAYARRRPQGNRLEAHIPTLQRDLGSFLVFFACGLALGLADSPPLHVAGAVALLLGYPLYARQTIHRGGEQQAPETLDPLVFDRSRAQEPGLCPIVVQFVVGLAAIAGGAHLFVGEAIEVANDLGVEVLVLSLVLAPLATELPEKANSFFWVRDGKDTLALGNVTGAMVFQSTLPVAFGLLATDWDLERFAVLSMALGLAGGAVAILALRLSGRFGLGPVLIWTTLYATFLVYVLLTA